MPEQRKHVCRQPIVRVDNVKLANQGACREKVLLEGTAHIPCLTQEINVAIEIAPMQENAVHPFVTGPAIRITCKEIDFVA